jgi:hypothetical protein
MAVIVSSVSIGPGHRLFVDSSTGVTLYPEWDYRESYRKIEDRHRTRSGREYVYKWGEYRQIKFSVEHLSSADQCTVNSWWSGNENLLFKLESSTDITSCRLVNKSKPIDKRIEPYMDEYKGKIELETY